MSKDINTVSLTGRLVRDMEVSYTSSGYAVGKFSVAVNRSVKKDGAWKEEASFFDITLFGKQAESLSQYMLKGKQVALDGELVQNTWEKDGVKRSSVSIIANNIKLMSSNQGTSHETSSAESLVRDAFGSDDDIPF